MNRGLSREPIFRTDKDRKALLDLLGDVHDRWGLLLYTGVYFSQPLGRSRGLEWRCNLPVKVRRGELTVHPASEDPVLRGDSQG